MRTFRTSNWSSRWRGERNRTSVAIAKVETRRGRPFLSVESATRRVAHCQCQSASDAIPPLHRRTVTNSNIYSFLGKNGPQPRKTPPPPSRSIKNTGSPRTCITQLGFIFDRRLFRESKREGGGGGDKEPRRKRGPTGKDGIFSRRRLLLLSIFTSARRRLGSAAAAAVCPRFRRGFHLEIAGALSRTFRPAIRSSTGHAFLRGSARKRTRPDARHLRLCRCCDGLVSVRRSAKVTVGAFVSKFDIGTPFCDESIVFR